MSFLDAMLGIHFPMYQLSGKTQQYWRDPHIINGCDQAPRVNMSLNNRQHSGNGSMGMWEERQSHASEGANLLDFNIFQPVMGQRESIHLGPNNSVTPTMDEAIQPVLTAQSAAFGSFLPQHDASRAPGNGLPPQQQTAERLAALRTNFGESAIRDGSASFTNHADNSRASTGVFDKSLISQLPPPQRAARLRPNGNLTSNPRLRPNGDAVGAMGVHRPEGAYANPETRRRPPTSGHNTPVDVPQLMTNMMHAFFTEIQKQHEALDVILGICSEIKASNAPQDRVVTLLETVPLAWQQEYEPNIFILMDPSVKVARTPQVEGRDKINIRCKEAIEQAIRRGQLNDVLGKKIEMIAVDEDRQMLLAIMYSCQHDTLFPSDTFELARSGKGQGISWYTVIHQIKYNYPTVGGAPELHSTHRWIGNMHNSEPMWEAVVRKLPGTPTTLLGNEKIQYLLRLMQWTGSVHVSDGGLQPEGVFPNIRSNNELSSSQGTKEVDNSNMRTKNGPIPLFVRDASVYVYVQDANGKRERGTMGKPSISLEYM
eukprot:m.157361 g.157361  ORF g.157361 m.157361 type:complete len:542 (+) comp17967_c0_seq3:2175-3800(+)